MKSIDWGKVIHRIAVHKLSTKSACTVSAIFRVEAFCRASSGENTK
nr:MAG TPA: hypothetical protein [Caudoviricetes sp.]